MVLKRIILAGLAVSLCAASCDLFLLPKRDRTNPNDPDNPVAAMQDFSAVAVSKTQVAISLTVPVVEDQSKLPAGFIIARTKDGFPTGPEDQSAETIVEDLGGRSGEIEISDDSLDPDTIYGYSVWSFGTEALSDHYTFSGSNTARTLDPDSDLETANRFVAWPHALDETYLEWSYTETGLEEPPGNLIVRKEGSVPPADPYDGVALHSFDGGYSMRDSGLLDNTDYSYGIWPADEDGTPYASAQTDQSPSLTVTVIIKPTSVSFQASEVATVRNTDVWNGSPSTLQVTADISASLIGFDLSNLAGKYIGSVINASLLLTRQSVTTQGVVEVFRTLTDWVATPPSSWLDVTNEGTFFSNDGYNTSLVISNSGTDYFAWDIQPMMQYLPDGFILFGESGPPATDVSFDPGGGTGPRLDIIYFGEP